MTHEHPCRGSVQDIAMSISEFQLRGVADPRLALHATSPLPAWLFSIDGSRVLWANPPAARAFGAANAVALAARTFSPADLHRRQVLQLARRLAPNGMPRLERLRGFGASLGGLVTCGCARMDFSDGSEAILVTATKPAGRTMPLMERLQRLIDGNDMPIAVFARDGLFVGASDAARKLLGFRDLAEAGLEQARHDALAAGYVEMPFGIGDVNLQMILQRVGAGADIALLAFVLPQAAQQTQATEAEPDATATESVETADTSTDEMAGVARDEPAAEPTAEITLVDEFAEPAPVSAAPMQQLATPAADDEQRTQSDAQPRPSLHAVDETPMETAMHPSQTAADDGEATTPSGQVSPHLHDIAAGPRRHPLRFTWQMDADDRFSLVSDDFIRLIGPDTAAGLDRPWSEFAHRFMPESARRIANALATRHTWSAVAVDWPVDGGGRLPVELSGLPVYDRLREFAGYRGFGVCRDLDALTELAALRRAGAEEHRPELHVLSAEAEPIRSGHRPAAVPPVEHTHDSALQPNDSEKPVETPGNVVPFRPINEQRTSTLTPIENYAFDEIARQLSARLENDSEQAEAPDLSDLTDLAEPPLGVLPVAEQPRNQPEWLAPPEPPALGESRRDRTLLDLLPTGILIYRLDRLLYANPAFLKTIGYDSLNALEQAGGLDALYVEAGISGASSTSETGTPVRISATEITNEAESTDARLHAISWDDDSALALILSPALAPPATIIAEPVPAHSPSAVGHANAEELGAILDTTAEGIIMFDSGGNIHACNRSAEALFGYDGTELIRRNLIELFAPENKSMVMDYLEAIKRAGVESLLDHGREVLGRVAKGGIIPLGMTMGRTRPDGPNFFAVFRDLSQSRKGENELQQARRLADRAANAKADLLAKISHEIRTPLNAIIGFAEVMLGERFGALGSERYLEYMKDIRSSGERVTNIINDLLELSRIETGKLNLAFTNQNLNELVESCVTAMQIQANRNRIIIRTSLAQALPSVVADTRALRQIAMNLIGSSIQLANAGGQVIVSTALSDFGEVVLRVRDTGPGLNESELAAALEPFRNQPPSDQASEGAAVSLSLTKALVEANRAQFNIRSAPQSGTMIEVVFPHALARAGSSG
jgi:PAS domain S-box-containing protein